MPLKQDRRFLQVREHPGGIDSVLRRFPLECLCLRTLECQTPVEVDPTEGRVLVEIRETVARERIGNLVGIPLLPGDVEPRHHAGVLVEARSFGQSTQSAFYLPNPGLKFTVGQSLFVQACQREEATVTSAL